MAPSRVTGSTGFWRRGILVTALATSVAGCTSIRGALDPGNVEYRGATTGPVLDVPPDLVTPQSNDRYTVPTGRNTRSQTLSDFNRDKAVQQEVTPKDTTVLPASNVVRIERDGNLRWIVVSERADLLWPQLKDFWAVQGFSLATDEPNLGIMETEWAERRQKVETDGIRGVLSRTLGTSYATGERDRYRTRLERLPGGGTEIYVSHRGMEEVVTGALRDQSIWQPRPQNPELEVEYLRRIAAMLGRSVAVSAAASGAAGKAPAASASAAAPAGTSVAAAPADAPSRTRLVTQADLSSIVLKEDFDRAWREVGIVLDRVGFTVEDRDRSKGTYFVRYVDLDRRDPKQGALSRFFSGERKDLAGQRYQIKVAAAEAGSSQIGVYDESGAAPATPENRRVANRIVVMLNDELK
jgi:outer membrane protein assembly factor BamC